MAGFAPIASLPIAAVPGTIVVVIPPIPSKRLRDQLFYRRRFTKKWHKGWRAQHRKIKFTWLPNTTYARMTWAGIEAVTAGSSTNTARVTWDGLEVVTPGPVNHPAKISWAGIEVVCSLQSFDDGILTIIL